MRRTLNTVKGIRYLPNGYTQLNYIQSDGTQWIDTLTTLDQNSSIKIKISNFQKSNCRIFGSRTSASSNNFSIITGNTILVADFQSYNVNRSTINFSLLTGIISVEISNNKIKIGDNERAVTSYSAFTTPGNAYIFNGSGSFPGGYSNAEMKLYSCQIYQNNAIIRDFIPCRRNSDNEVGLYDMVNNEFYENSGSGEFIGV